MGILLTWNMRQICSIPLMTEKSIGTDKEGHWVIEDIFIQTVPVEHNRIPRLYKADLRVHVDHMKSTMSDKGGKRLYYPN